MDYSLRFFGTTIERWRKIYYYDPSLFMLKAKDILLGYSMLPKNRNSYFFAENIYYEYGFDRFITIENIFQSDYSIFMALEEDEKLSLTKGKVVTATAIIPPSNIKNRRIKESKDVEREIKEPRFNPPPMPVPPVPPVVLEVKILDEKIRRGLLKYCKIFIFIKEIERKFLTNIQVDNSIKTVSVVSSESRGTSDSSTITENKPTIAAYAILHVYLARYGGQAVTQQNKNQLIKKYGYNSGDQLRNDFTLYQDDDKRLEINTNNKRAATTHLERFKKILPLLKMQNDLAYEAAKNDFEKLQKDYNKYS